MTIANIEIPKEDRGQTYPRYNRFVRGAIVNPNVRLIRQQNRLDKSYSFSDCIAMQTMRQLDITEVLTHDRHFTQEGFTILFP